MNKLRVALHVALTVLLPMPGIGLNITSAVGRVYSNVAVKDVLPDGIRFSHAKGAGFLSFKELPETMREQYGYDPVAADKHVRDRKREALMAQIMENMKKLGEPAEIKVIQVLDTGVLATGCFLRQVEHEETEYKTITRTVGLYAPGRPGTVREKVPIRTVKKKDVYQYPIEGTFFVADAPEHLVDGETYTTMLYPCGRYQYINTLSVKRTIAKYSTSVDKAVQHFIDEENNKPK